MSVKNYSPKLLEIFQLANQHEFKFDCKTPKKAIALRARLHALRRTMRLEKHWLTPVAEGVVISLDGKWLIAHPPDNELDEDLEIALLSQGLKREKLK